MRIHDTWADNDTPLTLELLYDGSWHDVTADLGDGGWTITRNPPDPTEFTCTLNNEGGKYSPRNPLSPLYGLVGRNTPLRAKVTTGGVTYTRFYGEVSAWPQRWTTKGTAYTTIEAAGVTRRLGQGASPLHSPMRRALTAVGPTLVGYWPMEDAEGSTVLAAVVGTPARIAGALALAASTAFVCSSPIPTLETGRVTATAPTHTASGESQVRFLLAVPAGTANDVTIARIWYTGGTLGYADVIYTTASGGTLTLRVTSVSGGSTWQNFDFPINDSIRWQSVELWQDGADVEGGFNSMDSAGTAYFGGLPTMTGQTLGTATSVQFNPNGATLTDVVAGHLSIETVVTDIWDLADPFIAYAGEQAHVRLTRLHGTYGMAITGTYSAELGPERTGTLLDVMAEAADSDGGILYEPRTAGGLAFRALESLYTQDPAATITYTDNLLLPFEPTEDDRATRNKVTVKRDGGSEVTSEVTSGALSTLDPPDGVGVYDEALTLSLAADGQLADQASWRTHLGTVDEARWPRVGIELAHPTFRADDALTADVLALDIGDRLVVTDLPAWLPPDDVDQLVVGYTETVTPKRYKLNLNCTPASPYRVGIYDDAACFYSGAGTVLAEALDTTETGVDVTAPTGVTWAHADGDYVVAVGGETMTVTGISGTAPNYTLTVARSVNGVVKAHSSGAWIDLAAPHHYGM